MLKLNFCLEQQSFSFDFDKHTYNIYFRRNTGWTISRRKIGQPKIPPTSWLLTINDVGSLEFRHSFHADGFEQYILASRESVEQLFQDVSQGKRRLPSVNQDGVITDD
jgi:hypothetical protein